MHSAVNAGAALLDYLRHLFAETGDVGLQVTVTTTDGKMLASAWVPPGKRSLAEHCNHDSNAGPVKKPLVAAPRKCREDILRMLGTAHNEPTQSQMMSGFAHLGIEWSQRTIADELSRMVKDGTAELGSNGQGYRLVDKEASTDIGTSKGPSHE